MIGIGILISEIVKSKEVCDASIPLLASQPQGIRSSIHSFYAALLASPLPLFTKSRQWLTVGHCPPSSIVDFHLSVGEDHSCIALLAVSNCSPKLTSWSHYYQPKQA